MDDESELPTHSDHIVDLKIKELRDDIQRSLDDIRNKYVVLRSYLEHVDSDGNLEDSPWYVPRYDAPKFRSKTPGGPLPRWQSVFQLVHYNDKISFDYNDIFNAVLTHGFHIKRESLRPKVFCYIEKGYLERLSNGKFRLTREGLVYFGVYEG